MSKQDLEMNDAPYAPAVDAAYLDFDPFGGAYVPCPCCGADRPEHAAQGFLCSVCAWQLDLSAEQNPFHPSDINDGLCLDEAQLSFRAFGTAKPYILEPDE